MKTISFTIKALFIFFLFCLLGCQQEEIQKENTGVVEATSSYLENFGVPPQGKAGRAYAAVGYLPVKDMSDKLGPLPIFIFSEENQLEKILKKLVSGDLVTSQKQIYYNPFPSDLKIGIKSDEGNLLTINLLTNESWQKDDKHTGILALKETALQFSHVENVKVMLNGAFVQTMPRKGFQKDSDLIIEVPPPILILMAGAWEKGQNEPEEILVEFDRPVKVENFKLYHLDGQEVRGEYYKSIFQMAVVIHPESPNLFSEDTTLRAEWSVVDELGRKNSGIDSMQLFKYEH
jgi:hypothetical protein